MSRALALCAVLLILIKLTLAAVFPVFGDEAYYIYWGTHPAGGFYDLPPMVGWWLAPLLKVSLNPLWLRILNLLTMAMVSLGLYELLRTHLGKARAMWGAGLFFFLPLPFVTVISFPDVPLLFFGFLSALLFYQGALRAQSRFSLEMLLSGSLFGAAFLSKYFAVFLLPAFVIWFGLLPTRRWRDGFVFALGAAPFLFQHIWWNQNHCWANFVFNLVTRQKVYEGTATSTTGFFLLYLVLASLPVLLSLFFGRRSYLLAEEAKSNAHLRLKSFFFFLWLIPALLFGFTALMGRGQGLHWLLFITPYFVGWTTLHFQEVRVKDSLKIAMGLSFLLGVGLVGGFVFPEKLLASYFKNHHTFEFELLTHPNEFVDTLRSKTEGVSALFLGGYSLASELHFEFERAGLRLPVSVWGEGSRFGRNFDFTFDVRDFENQRIAILTPGTFQSELWSKYFSSFKVERLSFRDASYTFVIADGFHAKDFFKHETLPAVHKFYPNFLPGVCPIKAELNAN